MSDLPRGPWLNLSVDFCGLLPSGDYLLVIVDEYSRFPVVEVVPSTSAEIVIPVVNQVFSLFGYLEVVKTDNGPTYNGTKCSEYMKECGVEHRKILPLWPQANSQTERSNKPLMKAIKIAHQKGPKWLPAMNHS